MAKAPVASLLFEDARWKRSYPAIAADVQHAVRLTLKKLKISGAHCTILFSDNSEIQQLNKDFRGKNKPTNVLSFPSGEADFLGDIALSYDVLATEKRVQHKTWRAHTLHLVIHGLLHLLGHDHEADAEAEEMEALEIALLLQLHLANPYE